MLHEALVAKTYQYDMSCVTRLSSDHLCLKNLDQPFQYCYTSLPDPQQPRARSSMFRRAFSLACKRLWLGLKQYLKSYALPASFMIEVAGVQVQSTKTRLATSSGRKHTHTHTHTQTPTHKHTRTHTHQAAKAFKAARRSLMSEGRGLPSSKKGWQQGDVKCKCRDPNAGRRVPAIPSPLRFILQLQLINTSPSLPAFLSSGSRVGELGEAGSEPSSSSSSSSSTPEVMGCPADAGLTTRLQKGSQLCFRPSLRALRWRNHSRLAKHSTASTPFAYGPQIVRRPAFIIPGAQPSNPKQKQNLETLKACKRMNLRKASPFGKSRNLK